MQSRRPFWGRQVLQSSAAMLPRRNPISLPHLRYLANHRKAGQNYPRNRGRRDPATSHLSSLPVCIIRPGFSLIGILIFCDVEVKTPTWYAAGATRVVCPVCFTSSEILRPRPLPAIHFTRICWWCRATATASSSCRTMRRKCWMVTKTTAFSTLLLSIQKSNYYRLI